MLVALRGTGIGTDPSKRRSYDKVKRILEAFPISVTASVPSSTDNQSAARTA